MKVKRYMIMLLVGAALAPVDGGHDYLRRLGNPDNWEELSETKEEM